MDDQFCGRVTLVIVAEYLVVVTAFTYHQFAVPEHGQLMAHQFAGNPADGAGVGNAGLLAGDGGIQVLHELTLPEGCSFDALMAGSLTSTP